LTLGRIGIVLKTRRGEANRRRPAPGETAHRPVARCGLGLEAQHAQNPLPCRRPVCPARLPERLVATMRVGQEWPCPRPRGVRRRL